MGFLKGMKDMFGGVDKPKAVSFTSQDSVSQGAKDTFSKELDAFQSNKEYKKEREAYTYTEYDPQTDYYNKRTGYQDRKTEGVDVFTLSSGQIATFDQVLSGLRRVLDTPENVQYKEKGYQFVLDGQKEHITLAVVNYSGKSKGLLKITKDREIKGGCYKDNKALYHAVLDAIISLQSNVPFPIEAITFKLTGSKEGYIERTNSGGSFVFIGQKISE